MGDLGKLIVAKGLKKLPKVQKIAQSGHTDHYVHNFTALTPQSYYLFSNSVNKKLRRAINHHSISPIDLQFEKLPTCLVKLYYITSFNIRALSYEKEIGFVYQKHNA